MIFFPYRAQIKLTKLIFVFALLFGVFFVTSYIGAGSAHKAFAKDVGDAMHTLSVRWTEEQGRWHLEKFIRQAAEKNEIILEDDAIEIDYIRDEIDSQGTKSFWGTQTVTTYHVRAVATITYDRKITPFYTKRITFSRSSREVRNWGMGY